MNNTIFHSPYFMLNLVTMLVLALPLVILVIKKDCRKPQFLPLATIFTLFLSSSLLNNRLPDLGENAAGLVSTASFLFLSPLALYFLLFFLDAPDWQLYKRAVRISLLGYLLAGLGIFMVGDLDENSGTLATGLGFLLVLLFGMPIFLRQIRIAVHKRTDTGKAFMIASIVFSFACYGLIFLMYFLFQSGERQAELYMLFQLTTVFFALLMTAGILLFKPSVQAPAPEKKFSKIPMLTEWEDYPQN